MSLTAALNSAATGLAANSKMVQTISSNTANALTAGYASREVNLSSAAVGGGVRVDGVSRLVDTSLLKEKWLSDAAAGNASTKADFQVRLEKTIGTTESAGSLGSLISSFQTALIESKAQPESVARLNTVATTAADLVQKLNAASDDIQSTRLEADRAIATQVGTLNTALTQIQELNVSITRMNAQSGDANGLIDQRQTLIDRIAEIVPVNTITRTGGHIALYTSNGQMLLDGTVATIGFDASNVMDPALSVQNGFLSGLTINGKAVSTSDTAGMGGGTLSATFAVRDDLAPKAQADLDAFTRNLIKKFQDPAIDPTLSVGDAGIFTDGGTALDAANEIGISGRIGLNTLIDPQKSAEVWRLRDGLAATAQGAQSDATLLSNLHGALMGTSTVTSGSFAGTQRTTEGLAADLLSRVSSNRLDAEMRQSYTSARQAAATEQVLARGVDTDAQLEKLQQVQQAYAANARVIAAVDAMMRSILEI